MPGTPDSKRFHAPDIADGGISKHAIDLQREQRRASPLGHHHRPQVQEARNQTQWVPPINAHRTHSIHSGVYVSWPTDYTYRPEIWKLPQTTVLDHTSNKIANGGGITTVIVTATVNTTITARDKTTTVPAPVSACSAQGGGSVLTPTVSTSTVSTSTLTTTPGTSSGSLVNTIPSRRMRSTTMASISPTASLNSTLRVNSKSYSVVPIHGSTASSSPAPSSAATAASSKPNQFVRTGYYNAAQQKAEGLMFLGNYGGQGSGKWTPYVFPFP